MTTKKAAAKTASAKSKGEVRPRAPAKVAVAKHAPGKADAGAELPILCCETPVELARWLSSHHASSRGIWLCLMKKATPKLGRIPRRGREAEEEGQLNLGPRHHLSSEATRSGSFSGRTRDGPEAVALLAGQNLQRLDEHLLRLLRLLAAALLASAIGLARGRSMVGAATEGLSLSACGAPLLLLLLVVGIDPRRTPTVATPDALLMHAWPSGRRTLLIALPLLVLLCCKS